MPALG